MARPTLAGFKKEALENPEVRAEYEALSPAYELRKKRVALRKAPKTQIRNLANADNH